MSSYSLEQGAESIVNAKTRKYFREVLNSYQNGNYRSAIVVLYSVVICDLVFKLVELRDVYGDQIATTILADIEILQASNPKSSEWETTLLEKVRDRTSFFGKSDYLHVNTLRLERHLSAHPVLSGHYELASPNQETVRAHIRNMLEGILTKPPLLSKQIFDDFVSDVAQVYGKTISKPRLEKYLTDKYFNNLTISIELDLFKSLWALAFNCKASLCKDNRLANLEVLSIIYKRHPKEVLQKLKDAQNDFGRKINPDLIRYLIYFCADHSEVYKSLYDPTKLIIAEVIEQLTDWKAVAWYTFLSIEDYIHWIKNLPDAGITQIIQKQYSVNAIHNVLTQNGMQEEYIDLFIYLYSKCHKYNYADFIWAHLEDLLPKMNETDIVKLLLVIEGNSQTYDRYKATIDHKLLYTRVLELDPTFNFALYPKFNKSIS